MKKHLLTLALKASVVDPNPDPHGSAFILDCWIRKMTHKSEEISVFKMLDVTFLRYEDFSFSLNILFGGLRISNLEFLD
jgi:hypothetical protein